MRVVIDTCVWVSAVLVPAGKPARLLEACQARTFDLVASEPVLEEPPRVLAKPRLANKYGITAEDIASLDQRLRSRAEVVPITGAPQGCRDPNDDMFVETAIAGGVDVLVSGDGDLTRCATMATVLQSHGIRVLTVSQFLDELEPPPPGQPQS